MKHTIEITPETLRDCEFLAKRSEQTLNECIEEIITNAVEDFRERLKRKMVRDTIEGMSLPELRELGANV